ncbi:MAG: methyltransferase domain-containing protein [Polyangiaceae bacterium]
MLYGKFGGRLPSLGNRFFSNMIVAGVHWRNATRRVRFALVREPKPQFRANDVLRGEFLDWVNRGYTKVNLGGGGENLEGYVNIDFAPNSKAQRQIVANVLDLSFIPDGALTNVHMNHVAEHFTKDELASLISSCARILKSGGTLSIRCPNALGVAYGFWFDPIVETDKEAFVRDGFPADEAFGSPTDKWMYRDFYGTLHWFFGDPGSVGNVHKTLVTPTLLGGIVRQAGFDIVRTSEPEAVCLVLIGRKP